MTAAATRWRMAGEEVGSCNCAWGCPCQFNALPTHGRCEAFVAWEVRAGAYGDVGLDGVRFAQVYHWPGPIHEGNGTRQLLLDERCTPTQRKAVEAITGGGVGGTYFEIFAAVCPNVLEPIVAPITLEVDRERRVAHIWVADLAETRCVPIRNPVTGEEHRVRIDLPNGFEYKQAEMGNTVHLRVRIGDRLAFEHRNTYAQLNAFDWKNF